MTDVFSTIIVPVDRVSEYRELAATVSGGEGMFMRQCLADGVITHYISSGKMSAELITLIADTALNDDNADISHDEPSLALSRMGLTLGDME